MALLLATTRVGKPVHATHRPAYLLSVQLHQQITRDLGEQDARYLAEPVYDAQSDQIDWYARHSAPVRGFAELSQNEQIQLVGEIETLRQRLRSLADRYQATTDPSQTALAHALRAAAHPPAAEYRFLVGEQPVAIFWGFQQEANDYPALLDKYIALTHPALPEASPAAAPPIPEPEAAPQSSTSEEPPDKARVEAVHNAAHAATVTPWVMPREHVDLLRFAGRILWGTAALMFLLALLLIAVNAFKNAVQHSTGSSRSSGSSVTEQLHTAAEEQAQLQRQLSALRAKITDCQCGPDETYYPKVSPAPAPMAQAPDVPADQPAPDDPPPEAQAAPPEEIEKVVESCDIERLAGRWQSHSNQLTNATSGEPVLVHYDFDPRGHGKIGVIQVDESQCRGNAKAEFKAASGTAQDVESSPDSGSQQCVLHITATPASCPGGHRSYSEHQVECRLDDRGQANCIIIQQRMQPLHAVFERRKRV